MKPDRSLTSIALTCLLCCVASAEGFAQQPSNSDFGCAVLDAQAFKEERDSFYRFFCGERSVIANRINTNRSASGSTSEQMVRLSRIVNKLKNGQDVSDTDSQFLAESMRRDPEILRIYTAVTTTRLFNSSKQKICRTEFASARERRETARLKAEIERTIACGARF